jgi:peptide deformylase
MHCIVDEKLSFDVDWKLLHTPSAVVDSDEDVKPLILRLVYGAQIMHGQGLAAPQIGELKRVCVVRVGNEFVPMVNPVLVRHGRDVVTAAEGCLSTEGHVVQVPRFRIVEVSYERWPDRIKVIDRLTGNDARIAQHEIDHLDGRLIVDVL